METFKSNRDKISEIVDLGEMMISFGEFIENNKVLFPGAFTESWWKQICQKKYLFLPEITDEKSAVEASVSHKIPLHPAYTYLWHDVKC